MKTEHPVIIKYIIQINCRPRTSSEPNNHSANQKIPRLLWSLKVHYLFTSAHYVLF